MTHDLAASSGTWPTAEAPSAGTRPVPFGRLSAGVVAHNEERSLAAAVRSLLDQRLPDGVRWEQLWIVASGCTDATVPVAEELARRDGRVQVVVQRERLGKAAALDEVVRRAPVGPLVLLNGDAVAEAGAVAALLGAARSVPAPYAVMARPVVDLGRGGSMERVVELLWALHHEFHLASLADGSGNHLSDELLLLNAPGFDGFPKGLINDGAFVGAWLDARGAPRLYAPEATVRIQVPSTWGDHLKQRRRILVGHAQTRELVGRAPSTLAGLLWSDPLAAARIVGRTLGKEPGRLPDLVRLAVPEVAAAALAAWDRLPPRRDHGAWERIARPVG